LGRPDGKANKKESCKAYEEADQFFNSGVDSTAPPAGTNVDEKQADDNEKGTDRTGGINNVLHELVYGNLLSKLG